MKCTHSAQECNGHTTLALIKLLIIWKNHSILSLIAQCKTNVTSFLMHRSYIYFALNHTVHLCQSLSPMHIRLSRSICDRTQLWPTTNLGCQLCILAITGSHHHVIYEGAYNRSNDNSLMRLFELYWWFNANSGWLESVWQLHILCIYQLIFSRLMAKWLCWYQLIGPWEIWKTF